MTQSCDVAIIGAGPYGLSAAHHLRSAGGLDVRVFGEPMSFWKRQMPVGMCLRSPWVACAIADPHDRLTLDRFEQHLGTTIPRPVPLDVFVQYGNWYRETAGVDVDPRQIARVSTNGKFALTTEDGEGVAARRVVVAAGIASFPWRPPLFDELPHSLASHSSEHSDFARFLGQSVAVIGGGQSALESAALLHEAGAEVEVLVRGPVVHWLVRSSRLHRFGWLRRLLYSPADIGPAGVSWIVSTPGLFKLVPKRWQEPMAERSIRPAAAAWVLPRVRDVPITTGRAVLSAGVEGSKVRLELADGTARVVDHVLLATGYRVDVSRYDFLSRGLVRSLRLRDGFPPLDAAFESPVPGLHFVGATAASSIGPLARFVAGTGYASRALVRGIVGRR